MLRLAYGVAAGLDSAGQNETACVHLMSNVTGSAHAVHMLCSCCAHAVHMLCSGCAAKGCVWLVNNSTSTKPHEC